MIGKLHSYYHVSGLEKNWFKMNLQNKVELFIDSGAFSAWSQKKEIDINAYISFIKENEHVIDLYANLDVIGSAESTWENQCKMEQAGLNPIPCYHYGEDEKWIRRLLRRQYPFIALGGMVSISQSKQIQWLDNIFSKYLTDNDGMPNVKVHGFGITSFKLMFRYPWYSVDSTSWVVTGRLGSVYIPRRRQGEWVYDENAWKISVSNKSPNLKEVGQHIETLSTQEKRIFLDYIQEKDYDLGKSTYRTVDSGYTLKENERWTDKKPKDVNQKREVETIVQPGISNKYQLRDELNIIYFMDLEQSMPKWPQQFKIKTNNRLL
ncbi:MAG: hypothetical protein ACFFDI_25820 [Promethearchaeota archaeon]